MKSVLVLLLLLFAQIAQAQTTTGGYPGGGGSVQGSSVEDFLGSCFDGQIPKRVGGVATCQGDSTGGTPSFDAVTNGTNTTATMTCTSPGCSVTGTGVHAADAATATTASSATSATTATTLAADPANCVVATEVASGIAANGSAQCRALTDADIPDTITINQATNAANCGLATLATNAVSCGNASSADLAAEASTTHGIDPAVAGRSLTSSGTNLFADAELYTRTDCSKLFVRDGVGIVDTDDLPDLYHYNYAVTITKLWCRTTVGTVTLNLQNNDGTPANIATASLACATTAVTACSGGCTTTLTSEATVPADRGLDMQIASVAGSPIQLSLCLTHTVDD